MKILITGGAGFIGSRLAARLSKAGHEVVVMDNLSAQIHGEIPDTSFTNQLGETVRFVRGDVCHIGDWLKALAGVEVVYHLAAETGTGQSMYQIAHYNQVNSQGTALLFEAAMALKAPLRKIVLASSRSIYGEGAYCCSHCSPQVSFTPGARDAKTLQQGLWEPLCPRCNKAATPIATSETATVLPASIYAATKYAQEDLVRIGAEAIGACSVILRFQNVYGEGQSLNNPYTGILSIFSTRIRRNLSLPIFEDGQESRDFVHVDDVVTALSLALSADVPNGSVYNVGSGVPTPVMQLAQQLVAQFKGTVAPHVTGEYRLGDIRHCFANLTRIQADLGFTPTIDLDEGLRRFSAWVLSQPLPEDKLDKANLELRERGLMAKS